MKEPALATTLGAVWQLQQFDPGLAAQDPAWFPGDIQLISQMTGIMVKNPECPDRFLYPRYPVCRAQEPVEKPAHLDQASADLLGPPEPVRFFSKKLSVVAEMGKTGATGDQDGIVVFLKGRNILAGQPPGPFSVTGGMHGKTTAT